MGNSFMVPSSGHGRLDLEQSNKYSFVWIYDTCDNNS